jgi:glycolate oxidase FAD binding subunit
MVEYSPGTELELAELIRTATGPFEISSRGSKRRLGRHAPCMQQISLAKFSGIINYEPEELVLEAAAATAMSDVHAALENRNQMLAFEPPDYSLLLGSQGSGSLAGLLNIGFSGPRRIKAGAVRDHVLGVNGVTGRGEIFKAGARVVKNVTGYDMPKLMAGSFGTLAAITAVTFKVLPRPEAEETLLLQGLDDHDAMQVMAHAMQSSCEVSGAAHLPGVGTLLRLEGIVRSVRARRENLVKLLDRACEVLDRAASQQMWQRIRDCQVLRLSGDDMVWRISVPPLQGAATIARISAHAPCTYYCDWAGGLIWLAVPAAIDGHAAAIRNAVHEGHAFLFKAPDPVRAAKSVFQPQSPGVRALSARIKSAFDPEAKLNPGRMYEAT